MPDFVLVDHDLRNIGGHNFQYSLDVLSAAEAAGFSPVLAANRRFTPPDNWPSHWGLLREFRIESQIKHSVGASGKGRFPIDLNGRRLVQSRTGWLSRIRESFSNRDRQRCIEDFAAGCASVFSQVGADQENRWLFPTFHDFDLLGLARFLKETPETQPLAWHLQFHFDIFAGRVPDFDHQQERRIRLNQHFTNALAQIPKHRLFFYTTTEQVAEQYNRLGVATFAPLPYPINARFLARQETVTPQKDASQCEPMPPTTQPERVVLAGVMRREKGRHHLAHLVDKMLRPFLDSGQIQLWLQGNRRNIHRLLSKQSLKNISIETNVSHRSSQPVVVVQHPLSAKDYVRLICQSDLGLFLYDSERYYSRCSGVLVEMLTAGVPVIVPAACWLAEQIQPATDRYLSRLADSKYVCDKQLLGQDNVPVSIGDIDLSWQAACRPPSESVDVMLDLGYSQQNPRGHYIRIVVELLDADSQPLDQSMELIRGPSANGRLLAIFPLKDSVQSIRVKLSNAFNDFPLEIQDPTALFLKGNNDAHHPRGAVGLISPSMSQLPGILDEFLNHRDHYQATAVEFSREWSVAHNPQRTIEALALDLRFSESNGSQGSTATVSNAVRELPAA